MESCYAGICECTNDYSVDEEVKIREGIIVFNCEVGGEKVKITKIDGDYIWAKIPSINHVHKFTYHHLVKEDASE